MLVFLCGMMGSGKTSLGKKLASKLYWDFIDLDQKIEEIEQKTVSEIFSELGEDYFRNLETKVLNDIINNHQKTIISLGGGTPCYNNNIKLINDNGLSIFINVDANKISNRLLNAKKNRPLIAKLDSYIKIKEYIVSKLKEREPFYYQCKIILEGKDIKAEKIIELLSKFDLNK